MDTAQAAIRDLAAMEAGPLRSTTPIGCSERVGHDHRGEYPQLLAYRQQPGYVYRASYRPLRNAWRPPSCSMVHSSIHPNRRMRTRMSGGVGGERS